MDTIIIGAGAAGLAAGRRLAAAGLRFVILEASDRIGGRAWTNADLFGVPVDLGAHWIHSADRHSLLNLGREAGLTLYAAPDDERLYIGGREAIVTEVDRFDEMWHLAEDAVLEAGRRGIDVDCRSVLPKLGLWKDTIESLLGPHECGKDCGALSTMDYYRAVDGPDVFCREGLGRLIAKLGEDLPIRFSTPVKAVDWSGPRVKVETAAGTLEAANVIVTVSTGVLAKGGVRFTPALPAAYDEAFTALRVGSFNHVVLDLPGNPFGWGDDEMIYAMRPDNKTETFAILANVGGSSLALAGVAGSYGEGLEKDGPKAMVDAATEFLIDLVGSRARRAVVKSHATQWGRDPLFYGAFSAAAPGRADARRDLSAPVEGKIFFAGEATHETLWGTVGGAWMEGERVAQQTADMLVMA